MKGIKLGGFFISAGMQKTILVIFTVYSVAVLTLGMLVHLKSRKTSRFSDFLTSGGKLNVMEVAMISAMGSMAGGTMIAEPGLTRSIAQAMQYLKNINDTLVSANSYTLPQAISIAIVSGWANALNPSFLQVPMMYDNTKVMKRAAVISCTMAFFTYLFMTATGPLSYIINPGLSHADYSTVYLTASLMPGWMAGIVVSAIFAAIQSSVSAFVLIIAGSITKDLYVDCFGGKAEEKKLKQINMILFAVFCCLCALIALNQNQLCSPLLLLLHAVVSGVFMEHQSIDSGVDHNDFINGWG